MKIRRRYTSEGRSPYEGIDFDRAKDYPLDADMLRALACFRP